MNCAVHNIVGVQRIAVWEAEQYLALAERAVLPMCDSCRYALAKIVGEDIAKITLDKGKD